MFIDFFYLLRDRGLDVSMSEWLVLMDALKKGLHGNSLMGFYRLCRAILLRDESQYDPFDVIFYDFFKEALLQEELTGDDLKEIEAVTGRSDGTERIDRELLRDLIGDPAEAVQMMEGGEPGNAGIPGMQMGSGPSGARSAIIEAGSRTFRDFRKDNVLDTRQFQMAFRLLRSLSEQSDSSELEFDIDNTIHRTADRGGLLSVEYKKPRKNTIRVILAIDSGGSMAGYARLCSHLFQAAVASRHLKELRVYYFHNCIYSALYDDPQLTMEGGISVDKLISTCDEKYRVILVGDAEMHPYEFHGTGFNWVDGVNSEPGDECLERIVKHFPHTIWLNPSPMPDSEDGWTETHMEIARIVKMYDLTLDGLEKGMRFLLNGK